MAKKQIKRGRKGAPKSCFVMQVFDGQGTALFQKVLQPAITAAGFEPKRADSIFGPRPILQDIVDLIDAADLCLADVSQPNPNVYYELGLAHAFGKPVVLLTADAGMIPFDLKPLRHVVYSRDNPTWGADLRQDIVRALTEVSGDPTSAIYTAFLNPTKTGAPEIGPGHREMLDLQRRVASLEAQSPHDYGTYFASGPLGSGVTVVGTGPAFGGAFSRPFDPGMRTILEGGTVFAPSLDPSKLNVQVGPGFTIGMQPPVGIEKSAERATEAPAERSVDTGKKAKK